MIQKQVEAIHDELRSHIIKFHKQLPEIIKKYAAKDDKGNYVVDEAGNPTYAFKDENKARSELSILENQEIDIPRHKIDARKLPVSMQQPRRFRELKPILSNIDDDGNLINKKSDIIISK